MLEIQLDLELWVNWLYIKGLGDRTILEYASYLDKMGSIKLSQSYFIEYLKNHNNGVAKAFLNNLLLYIKTSDVYSIEVKAVARGIELPKLTGRKRKKIPDCLTEPEIFVIAKTFKSERAKLMLLVTFYGGLRVSELVGEYAIKPYDFNWNVWLKNPEDIGILKLTGKGNKERQVYIPQILMARLYQWINNVVVKKQSKEEKLFDIGARRWNDILSAAARKSIGRHIHPHIIRHSTNMWLKSMKWEPRERQLYMGHEDIKSTIEYDHTDHRDLKIKWGDTMSNSEKYLNLAQME